MSSLSGDQPGYTIQTIYKAQDNLCSPSPARGRAIAIAIGIILLAGAAIAAWQLHAQMGFISLTFLALAPIGLLLIAKSKKFFQFIRPTCCCAQKTSTGGTLYIGGPKTPLNEEKIKEKLASHRDYENLDALVIYGDGNVEINQDPGILSKNPKKIILIGARIIRDPQEGIILFDDQLRAEEGWHTSRIPLGPPGDTKYKTHILVHDVMSLYAAEADIPPRRSLCERYRVVYQVAPEGNIDNFSELHM